jgi:hypothetical protein
LVVRRWNALKMQRKPFNSKILPQRPTF